VQIVHMFVYSQVAVESYLVFCCYWNNNVYWLRYYRCVTRWSTADLLSRPVTWSRGNLM